MIDWTNLTGEALSQFQTQIYLNQLLRSKLSCLVGGIAVIGAFIIGIKQIKISKEQIRLANEQIRLSDEQGSVIEKQNSIIEGQTSFLRNIRIILNNIEKKTKI